MRSLRLIPLLALVVAACSVAAAPTATPAAPRSSPSPIAAPSATPNAYSALTGELQAVLDNQVKAGLFVSLSAAVLIPGGYLWSGAAGQSDFASALPATPDTSYSIAIVTETFVATLVLELAHDGVLRLDDPIGRWLPELRTNARFSADRITIRQLLSHTSGLGDYAAGLPSSLGPKPTLTTADLLEYVGARSFEPGADFGYCSTDYLLAGLIVEKATGAKLAAVLHQRILDPLRLDRTRIQPQDHPAAPAAHGYDMTTTPGKPVDRSDGTGYLPNQITANVWWAAAAMTSTASDLARWGSALYGGKVLDAGSLTEMLDVKRYADLPHSADYGLGVFEVPEPWTPHGSVVGNIGGDRDFRGALVYATGPGLVAAVLTNGGTTDLSEVAHSLVTIALRPLGG